MSCSRKPRTPRYDAKKGWIGDSKTLYAVVDKMTGQVVVRPGNGMRGVGENVALRLATRDEAARLWQEPLHPGWVVDCKKA